MEIKNIHKHAGWYASYMYAEDGGNDRQGQALVECQSLKIKQLLDLVENIKGEIELVDDPREYSEKTVLESIKEMLNNIPEVEYTVGSFKWIG